MPEVSLKFLRTLISEVEAIVNDRPISYATTDIDDISPLIPFMLWGVTACRKCINPTFFIYSSKVWSATQPVATKRGKQTKRWTCEAKYSI